MSENPLNQVFEERVQRFREKFVKLRKRNQVYSIVRILLFVLFVIATVYFANAREITWLIVSVVLFVVVFIIIIKKHNRLKFLLKHTDNLVLINELEIRRLQGDLTGLPTGVDFLNSAHEYAPDLDVFGSNSLFQLLNRSNLLGSANLMSRWLLTGADAAEIKARQLAIAELKPLLDWRQDFTAQGMHIHENQQSRGNFISTLVRWLRENVIIVDKPIWAVLAYLVPAITLVLLIGIVFLDWTYHLLYAPIIFNAFVLKVLFQPMLNLTKEFDNVSHLLPGYENLIRKIEHRNFESKFLQDQKAKLVTAQSTASQAIKSLHRTLNGLQNRTNLLYLPFNVLFLLDLILLRRALRWNKAHQNAIASWFDAIYHIDAISDLASFSYINPTYTVPEILAENIGFKAAYLGHPLIKPGQRIANSCTFEKKGTLGLITGSNMSGKSTFLRTVGINLVLAQMGAPVCADSFQFSLMRVFTNMRTQDSLEENVSSFYAELQRIRQLLNLIGGETPVFYLLDEILKGTNSEDRNKGAIALIHQLVAQHCIGLISTHDLHLSTLSKEYSQIENFSFNSTIDGDEIIFDYQLTPGACKNFNASKLMELMGIIKP